MSFPTWRTLTATISSNLIDLFNRLQTQLKSFIDSINELPQLQTIQLSVSLSAGNNTVPHTLGKVLTGWSVWDTDQPTRISRYAPSNNISLFLHSDVACHVILLVY